MPTLFNVSDEKQTMDSPTVVIAETTSSSAKPRNTKKYVIIAVSGILAAAIILAAILVGMYMFTEAQKDILKYTLTFNNNAQQEVTSDPNENVVQYHVSNPGQETWIVNDFNKDIQVVKIQSGDSTNCYVDALNRSAAMDPSKIAKPQSDSISGVGSSLIYTSSGTPISDTSFLTKTARDMCQGVSVYWVYPRCMDKSNANANDTGVQSRSKRQSGSNDPYYDYWFTSDGKFFCVAGCCKYVCACSVNYTWTVDPKTNAINCNWVVPASCASTAYGGCYNGPKGLNCPNKSPATWPTC